VTRTNIYVLIACAFLGMLLYVVLGIVDQAQTPPALAPTAGPAPAEIEVAPGAHELTTPAEGTAAVPKLRTHADLLAILSAAEVNPNSVLPASRSWLQERGFLGSHELLGVGTAEAPVFFYQSLDGPTLEAMSQKGDLGALQALAAQNLLIDPFLATDLYSQAAAEGSDYAMLQIASLLETFSSISPADYDADSDYARKLARFRASRGERELQENALAFALAALRSSGAPVAQPDVLSWIQRLAANFAGEELNEACQLSARIFFEMSAIRRSRGKLRLSSQPPPVFFTAPDLAEQMPCGDTRAPVDPVLDIADCRIQRVEDARRRILNLHVCE